jgi:branched-chain amino acid transport system permease protein
VLLFVSLVVDGVLAGAVYALIALAFVVVYKASRMINFALGEWVMFGSRLSAVGMYGAGLGPAGALAMASAAMVAFALAFNRVVLRRLVGRPLIGVIMVTLGLGALMRGVAPLVFGGLPAAIPLPVPMEPLVVYDLRIPAGRVVALAVALVAIAGIGASRWQWASTCASTWPSRGRWWECSRWSGVRSGRSWSVWASAWSCSASRSFPSW